MNLAPGQLGRFIKLSAAAVIFSAVWGYLLFALNNFTGLAQWLIPAGLLIVLIPMVVLFAIISDPRLYFILSSVWTLAYLLFFPLSLYSLFSLALLFYGFWRVMAVTVFELSNSVKFSPSNLLQKNSAIILPIVLLVIVTNLAGGISEEIIRDEPAFYNRLSGVIVSGLIPVLENQVPGFDRTISLDQYLYSTFTRRIPNFQDLPPETRQPALDESRKDLTASLGIQATGSTPMSDVARLAVAAKLQAISQASSRNLPLSIWAPLIYALIIYSLLKIFALPARWLAVGLGSALFWFLRRLRFYHITTVQVNAEQIEI